LNESIFTTNQSRIIDEKELKTSVIYPKFENNNNQSFEIKDNNLILP